MLGGRRTENRGLEKHLDRFSWMTSDSRSFPERPRDFRQLGTPEPEPFGAFAESPEPSRLFPEPVTEGAFAPTGSLRPSLSHCRKLCLLLTCKGFACDSPIRLSPRKTESGYWALIHRPSIPRTVWAWSAGTKARASRRRGSGHQTSGNSRLSTDALEMPGEEAGELALISWTSARVTGQRHAGPTGDSVPVGGIRSHSAPEGMR